MENLFSVDALIATTFGAILYFLFAFKKMKLWDKEVKFSIPVWIKDNWFNVVLTLACLAAINYLQGETMNKMTAFMFGFSWNKVVDYVQDFTSKKTLS